MLEVISAFSIVKGSCRCCFLVLFLCIISAVMCPGSSLLFSCILHFGMLCLSACKVILVNIVFAMCMFIGVGVS